MLPASAGGWVTVRVYQHVLESFSFRRLTSTACSQNRVEREISVKYRFSIIFLL